MPAWIAGIRVRKNASGDVHVSLDSSTPCWNDTIRSCTKLTRRPSTSGIFKGGGEEPETRIAEWTSNLKQLFSSFVLIYFRICARRANFSHLETLGFGYSSRQDAKNAKFGNLFYFAPLRLCGKCSDSFWLRLRRARLFVCFVVQISTFGCALLNGIFDDLGKAFSFKRGSAHQCPIHIRLAHQLPRVGWLDAPAILNANAPGSAFVK